MSYNSNIYHRHRRSIRLKDYDYSQAGVYFITICTKNKECLFGEVFDGEMKLNEVGKIVENEWLKTAIIRPNIDLDNYVVMPNHMHGIIVIIENGRGTLQRAPTVEKFGKPTSNSIPTIIRLFKSITTTQINILRNLPCVPVWQRNYYEHIIRHQNELNKIQEYIQINPMKWEFDHENIKGIQGNYTLDFL